MVAPPDPVAVEAVAGPVRMPRRLLSVLQSEGLFNDATALVVFQTAVLATVSGGAVSAPTLVLRFVLGVMGAVAIGVVVAFVARWIMARVTDTTGRSALTLVLPFAVYVAADEVGASGVVAVVVLALQLRAASGADEAAERLVQRSFWDVVELLVTGVAFGLMGLDLRQVAEAGGADLPADAARRGRHLRGRRRGAGAVDVGGVVDGGRSDDPERSPRTGREAVVLSWCGMRGLATLALALSLPTATAAGEAFPQRAEIVLIAVVVLVVHAGDPGVHAAVPRPAARRRDGRRRGARRRAGDRAAAPGRRRPPCSPPTTGSTGCPRGRHEPAAADGPPRRPAARRPDVDGGPRARRNRAPLP